MSPIPLANSQSSFSKPYQQHLTELMVYIFSKFFLHWLLKLDSFLFSYHTVHSFSVIFCWFLLLPLLDIVEPQNSVLKPLLFSFYTPLMTSPARDFTFYLCTDNFQVLAPTWVSLLNSRFLYQITHSTSAPGYLTDISNLSKTGFFISPKPWHPSLKHALPPVFQDKQMGTTIHLVAQVCILIGAIPEWYVNHRWFLFFFILLNKQHWSEEEPIILEKGKNPRIKCRYGHWI